jgi:hypothetical protein
MLVLTALVVAKRKAKPFIRSAAFVAETSSELDTTTAKAE